jgi:hypothetical protein
LQPLNFIVQRQGSLIDFRTNWHFVS